MNFEFIENGFLDRVHLEHTPVATIDENRHVEHGNNAVLAQHIGVAEFRIVADVLAYDRCTRLQRAPW